MLADLTNTSEYQDWQWDLTTRLRGAVESAYAQGAREVACVEAMVQAITGITPATSAQVPASRVEVEGAFLHGSRSQVKFSIGGAQHQRELADLLVLGSYVENGVLKWQRACFIQAKKGNAAKAASPCRFTIDEWQLALLRSFPEFEGVSGVFAGVKCHLRNRTGMLGAYGFLVAPGDFTVISARVLNHVLGGRKSVVGKELTPTILSERATHAGENPGAPNPWWPFDPEHCPECKDVLEHCFPFPWHRCRHDHTHAQSGRVHRPIAAGASLPASILSCLGLDEFVDSWTALRLGESWRKGAHTRSELGLRRALFRLVSRVARGTGGLSRLLGLLSQTESNDLPPTADDSITALPGGGGLAVLSAVASSARPE
jgi:hypothetical protein